MANGLFPKHLLPTDAKSWDAIQMSEWQVQEALKWGPGTHPIDQAKLYFPYPLYQPQIETLCAFARPHSRAILSTCNEAGKTSCLILIAGLSVMCAFPGSSVCSTSASGRQLVEQLFERHLREIVEQDTWQAAGWRIRVSKDEGKVTAPNGSTWLGYVCKDAKNVEGFHGKTRVVNGVERYCPLAYINDESKGIGDDIRIGEKRIDPDFEMSVSTPGEENGWFYEGLDPDTLKAGSR